MLLMAMAMPETLDILGITAVAGNVPLELTQRNIRIIRELAARPEIPVFAGCAQPLERELITAENVHGSTGIDGARVIEPRQPLAQEHAVDFMIDTLTGAAERSVSLVPTGPLTNIGSLLRRRPDLTDRVEEIVLMGGAMREGGNVTPSAEFNIRVDPEAAETVLSSGIKITMVPLDVTHQVLVDRESLAEIRGMRSEVARATAGMLEFFNRHDSEKYGSEGAPLHDPCTIAWILRPQLFEGRQCNVAIETQSPLTLGHTAVDFWGVTQRPHNALWLHNVDRQGFFDLLIEALARYE